MYKKDCRQVSLQASYLKQQQFLNSANWETWCLENTIDSKTLQKLQKMWQQNKAFSHYTSEALYIAAMFILPIFEEFYVFAESELASHAKKIVPFLLKNLKNYLTCLKHQIQTQQHIICDAMLGRLEIAAETNMLKYDDITHFITRELYHLGIAVSLMAETRFGLTPELFCRFHEYIMTHGNKVQRMRLQKLKWLQPDDRYYSQQIDHQWLIVPSPMKKFNIPVTTRQRFTLFFKWHNWKVNFFKHHFYQLVQMKAVQDKEFIKPMLLREMLKATPWQMLVTLETAIAEDVSSAESFFSSRIKKLFFRKYCEFYNEWTKFCSASLQDIVRQKLNFTTLLSEELLTRISFDLDTEIITSLQTKEMLHTIINNMETTLAQYNKLDIGKWHENKKILLSAINYVAPSPLSTKSPESSLKTGQLSATEAINVLNHILFNLVQRNVFNIAHPLFEFNLLKLEKLLVEYQTIIEKTHLNHFWWSYFTSYLESCLKIPNAATALSRLMSVMLRLSPVNLQERAALLEETKQKKSDFIYKTQCRALLFSLKETVAVFKNNERALHKGDCDANYRI